MSEFMNALYSAVVTFATVALGVVFVAVLIALLLVDMDAQAAEEEAAHAWRRVVGMGGS